MCLPTINVPNSGSLALGGRHSGPSGAPVWVHACLHLPSRTPMTVGQWERLGSSTGGAPHEHDPRQQLADPINQVVVPHGHSGWQRTNKRLELHQRPPRPPIPPPSSGYDKAAAVAKHAHAHRTSLEEAALALGAVASREEFRRWVRPEAMLEPGEAPGGLQRDA